MRKTLQAFILILATSATAFSQSQRFVLADIGQPLTAIARSAFLRKTAEIVNPIEAKKLLRLTILPNLEAPGAPISEFVLIHTLRWGPKDTNDRPTVQEQHWYVFRDEQIEPWSNEDFTERNRLMGVRRFHVLYVHLDRDPAFQYVPEYEIMIKKKQSANVANLFRAAQLFLPTSPPVEIGAMPAQPTDLYYGTEINNSYDPASITITPHINSVEGLKAQEFDNEGRARWDIGIGVPIKRLQQLSFNSENNTVTAKEIERNNFYALLALYPKGRDLKGTDFSWWPAPIAGVAISKQPLHRILLGGSWGPHFAQFYAGVLMSKNPELSSLQVGQSTTPEVLNSNIRYGYKSSFAFGISLGLRAGQEMLRTPK